MFICLLVCLFCSLPMGLVRIQQDIGSPTSCSTLPLQSLVQNEFILNFLPLKLLS